MSATVVVYAALSIQSYLHFLDKSHFGNIYIYNKHITYVTQNYPPDFNRIESTRTVDSTIFREVRRMRQSQIYWRFIV